MNVWVNEKERLASLSVLSRRATKRASRSLANTETELEGRGNVATILVAERCRRRWVGPRRVDSRGGVAVRELEWLGVGRITRDDTPAGVWRCACEKECDAVACCR